MLESKKFELSDNPEETIKDSFGEGMTVKQLKDLFDEVYEHAYEKWDSPFKAKHLEERVLDIVDSYYEAHICFSVKDGFTLSFAPVNEKQI